MASEGSSPQWLYQLRLSERLWKAEAWTPENSQCVSEHFQYVQDLARKGVMLVVGRTQGELCNALGLAIFYAESEEDARQIMLNDPAVQRGIMSASLAPYRIAVLGHAVDALEKCS